MPTSAEQFHHRRLTMKPEITNDRRLFIDLDRCASGDCPECSLRCSYYYHDENNGIFSVAELVTFVVVCRKCEDPHCVSACPVDALEQQADKGKILVRHNLRCISCKSCSYACPYGTIYPENLPRISHVCDFCLDRRKQKNQPLCVSSCPNQALKLVPGNTALEENMFYVGDNIIVHSTHWENARA